MTQFDYPQGHKHKAMVSFTFRVYSEVPFSLYAGNGKCRWLVNKAEIDFAKISFVDCKWSNLNAPLSYNPWCHSLLVFIVECPFALIQEKGNVAC